MATYIPNQPVYFGEPDECEQSEIEYNQLVDNGDVTQFQLQLDICSPAVNMITNPGFDTATDWAFFGTTFAIGSGKLFFNSTPTGNYVSSASTLTPDKYYAFVITVDSMNYGDLIIKAGSVIIGTIYSAGTHTFYGYQVAFNEVYIISGQTGTSAVIDSVYAYEIKTDFIVLIKNKANNVVNKISYVVNPEYFKFFKDSVTVTIDWAALEIENGCYYLCVLDPCNNTNGQNYPIKIMNCQFDANNYWYKDYWVVGTGIAVLTFSPPTVVSDVIMQYDVFPSYSLIYYITIDVEISGDSKLEVYFGDTLVETITETGIYNVSGVPTNNLNLYLIGTLLSGSDGYVILNSVCPSFIPLGNAEITNCEFESNAIGWTGWTYSAGSMVSNFTTTGVYQTLEQSNVFANFVDVYSVEFSAVITGDVTLEVYYGSNKVYETNVSVSTIVTGSATGDLGIHFKAKMNTGVSGSVNINHICNVDQENVYSCDYNSNMFKLSDLSQSCTLLINGCNNDDGLGFVVGESGFSPRIRLNAKIKQAKYASEKTIYDDSKGERRNVFYKRRKAKNLVTDLEPEYVHDFLSTLVGIDKFYINGKVYVCDDTEYNIEYPNESDSFGKVKLLISEKVQQVRNTNCTDTNNECNLEENLLLRADDPNSFVTQTDGSFIKIQG